MGAKQLYTTGVSEIAEKESIRVEVYEKGIDNPGYQRREKREHFRESC